MNGHETTIAAAVQWLRLAVETTGAAVVALGALIAVVLFLRGILTGQAHDFNAIRLVLARYLALALEFQLGADILSTAIAPSLEEIGKLGAIAPSIPVFKPAPLWLGTLTPLAFWISTAKACDPARTSIGPPQCGRKGRRDHGLPTIAERVGLVLSGL